MATEYKYIPIVYRNGSANMNAAAINKAVAERADDFGNYYSPAGHITSDDTAYKQTGVIKKDSSAVFVKKGVLSTILVIMAVFLMLMAVLAGNARISSVTIENSRLSNEISMLKNEISDIELEISLATDLDYIQQRASELGMGVPSSDQIVYVQSRK